MVGEAIITIGDKQWNVSIATAPGELVQGLGNIPEIPQYTGMLFDLSFKQAVTVTTEPMLFALDIAFLSDEMVVTEVYRNVPPGYLVHSTKAARYFLEVNAGEMEDIETGNRALVDGLDIIEAVASPLQQMNDIWSFGISLISFGFMLGLMKSFEYPLVEA